MNRTTTKILAGLGLAFTLAAGTVFGGGGATGTGYVAWGAVDGWPGIDPDDLDAGPTVTITFDAVDGGTRMTLRLDLPAGISDAEARDWFAIGIEPGMKAMVRRRAELLAFLRSALMLPPPA